MGVYRATQASFISTGCVHECLSLCVNMYVCIYIHIYIVCVRVCVLFCMCACLRTTYIDVPSRAVEEDMGLREAWQRMKGQDIMIHIHTYIHTHIHTYTCPAELLRKT
jgi:hypothetical protein